MNGVEGKLWVKVSLLGRRPASKWNAGVADCRIKVGHGGLACMFVRAVAGTLL